MNPSTRNRLNRHARAWEIAKMRQLFTCHDLSADTGYSVDYCRRMINDWERTGYIVFEGYFSQKKRYKVSSKPGAPKVKTLDGEQVQDHSPQDALWRAMRGVRVFTPRDLVMHANTAQVPVTEKDARDYCRFLARAGYLRVEQKASPEKDRPATYRLVRNTGPRAPRKVRIPALTDDNLGQVTFAEGVPV